MMETINLIGGPGDGQSFEFERSGAQLSWRPGNTRDLIAARMFGHSDLDESPVLYVRSLRTRSLFVYQP